MMKPSQLLAICIVSAVCAITVSLILIAMGLKDSVPVAAAVSSASAATVASIGFRRATVSR